MLIELRTPVAIQTNLSRAEVIDRLARSIASPGYMFPLFGPFGIVGRTGPEHCWIESGSFFRRTNRRLTLRYQDGAAGTILRGQFAVPTLQLIPIVAVFGMGTLMCLRFTVQILKSFLGDGTTLTLWEFTPFVFLFAAYLMLKFNLWLARRSENRLIETIQDLLKGPPASTGDTWSPHSEIVIRPRRDVF